MALRPFLNIQLNRYNYKGKEPATFNKMYYFSASLFVDIKPLPGLLTSLSDCHARDPGPMKDEILFGHTRVYWPFPVEGLMTINSLHDRNSVGQISCDKILYKKIFLFSRFNNVRWIDVAKKPVMSAFFEYHKYLMDSLERSFQAGHLHSADFLVLV